MCTYSIRHLIHQMRMAHALHGDNLQKPMPCVTLSRSEAYVCTQYCGLDLYLMKRKQKLLCFFTRVAVLDSTFIDATWAFIKHIVPHIALRTILGKVVARHRFNGFWNCTIKLVRTNIEGNDVVPTGPESLRNFTTQLIVLQMESFQCIQGSQLRRNPTN